MLQHPLPHPLGAERLQPIDPRFVLGAAPARARHGQRDRGVPPGVDLVVPLLEQLEPDHGHVLDAPARALAAVAEIQGARQGDLVELAVADGSLVLHQVGDVVGREVFGLVCR